MGDRSTMSLLAPLNPPLSAWKDARVWIVDPIESCITVLSLEGAAYALVGKFGLGEQAASKLLDGFTVDVAATFKAAEGAH